jgi:DNA-binding NarL/FixJ family response regulator
MQVIRPPTLSIRISNPVPLIAAGLAASLCHVPGFLVTVEPCSSPQGASGLADVLVRDYEAGLKLASEARVSARTRGEAMPKVMVVTPRDREHDIRHALEAGVFGYLLLDSSPAELEAGIKALAAGSRYLSMSVAQRMADSMTREALTARESEVLSLLACGECNKSIARRLEIAVGTVKAHVGAIMDKLEASSRTQAARIAQQRGLVC